MTHLLARRASSSSGPSANVIARGERHETPDVGPYRLRYFLGGGGTALAYAAERVGADSFSQPCCLKVILPHLRQDPDFQRCLRREAAIGASLRHSNIAALREADVARGLLEFEFIEGANLHELRQALPERRLAPELVVYVALRLTEAFEYAHAQGVVHRDVSSSNVMLTCHGEVKLLDFGVAMKLDANERKKPTTDVRGTPQYMAPEHFRNEDVTGRIDLFALGAVCYELLTGRLPATGDSGLEIYNQHLHRQYPRPDELVAEIHPELADVVMRLLEPEASERFGSAGDCFDALAPHAPAVTVRRELGRLAAKALAHARRNGRRSSKVLDEGDLPAWVLGRTSKWTTPPTTEAKLLLVKEHEGHAVTRKDTVPLTLEAVRVLEQERQHRVPDELGTEVTAVSSIRHARRRFVPLSAAVVIAGAGVAVFAAMTHGGANDSSATLRRGTTGAESLEHSGHLVRPVLAEAPASSVVPPSEPSMPQPGVGEAQRDELVATLPASAPASEAEPVDLAKASPQQARAQAPEGSLHVGVLPLRSNVWVDGESVGRSPLVVRVSPGKHVVGVGQGRPVRTRHVTVRAGERREIFVDLNAEP